MAAINARFLLKPTVTMPPRLCAFADNLSRLKTSSFQSLGQNGVETFDSFVPEAVFRSNPKPEKSQFGDDAGKNCVVCEDQEVSNNARVKAGKKPPEISRSVGQGEGPQIHPLSEMKRAPIIKRSGAIPKDAVLLIPGPEPEGEKPAYGVKPGYYNSKQMLQLLDNHKDDADAVHFIADMLETGDDENDGFAQMLRQNHHAPAALASIIQICRT